MRRLLLFAALLRLALLLLGLWQDSRGGPRYTDVDYDVFTDAARALAERRSPARAARCVLPLNSPALTRVPV
jgi:phosphatidylinositol glycan class M